MSFMFDHCVKDRQQFAHAGNQSYLRRFAGVTQSSVEILDNRVTSTGDQRSHVQRGTNRRPSAPNGTAASKNPTIPIKRRHTHQGSDLFTIKLPRSGSSASNVRLITGPNARNTLGQILFLTPNRPLSNVLVQIFTGASQFRFQPPNVSINTFSHRLRRSTQPITFRHIIR